jgi:hypothetical protein
MWVGHPDALLASQPKHQETNIRMRMTAAQYQNQFGSGIWNQDVSVKKPAIRLPKATKMSKPEAEYERILRMEFPTAEVKREAISFKLDGGNYTPDFTVWQGSILVLAVEVKGAYRLHSAGRSHFAYKTAKAAWPHVRFRFAQREKNGWSISCMKWTS